MTYYQTYVKKALAFFHRFKILVLLVWVVVLQHAIYIGPKFLNYTSNEFDTPVGSGSHEAMEILKRSFPGVATSSNVVALVQRDLDDQNLTNILNDDVKGFTQELNTTMKGSRFNKYILGIQGYYLLDERLDSLFPSVRCKTVAPVVEDCVHSNSTSTLIIISVDREHLYEVAQFTDFVLEHSTLLREKHLNSSYTVKLTGDIVFFKDITNGTIDDMERMDSITLPLAMFVLVCVLKSARLMIVPLASIIVSIGISFMSMYPIALHISVASTAPSMMMSIIIAMSVDYSLFLLCRFKEEIQKGKTTEEAVGIMYEHAGHTVTVSGITLSFCLFGMIFFPVKFIATQGLSAGIALLVTLLVNLTLTPCLLLIFPQFFGNKHSKTALYVRKLWNFTFGRLSFFKRGANISPESQVCESRVGLLTDNQRDDEDEEFILGKVIQAEAVDTNGNETEEDLENKFWYRLAIATIKYRYFTMGFICLLVVPFSYLSVTFTQSLDLSLMTPRGVESTQTYLNLEKEFGAGYLFPYQITVESKNNTAIMSNEAFTQIRLDINNVIQSTHSEESSLEATVTGVMFLPSPYEQISYNELALKLALAETDPAMKAQIEYYLNAIVDQKRNVTYLTVTTQHDPFSPEGIQWLRKVRELLKGYSDAGHDYEYYIYGSSVVANDCEEEVYKRFPMMIGITLAVVFVVITIAFRSIFVPIRSIFTLFCTLVLCYGSATLCYQHGFLTWTQIPGLAYSNGLSWLSPVMAFSIIIGLGLDYDIFLLSRIIEYRSQGYSEHSSIARGVFKTGPIITAAGLIMAIAFAGLLLVGEMALNQIAFYLVVSVLIDTFIIRTILVPSIMGFLGKLNWWPRKLIEPFLS